MNTFLSALENAENTTYTENGAETLKSTKNRNLDLFFAIGASRNNKMIVDIFDKAFAENEDLAIRILLWSRDIRGGAGERSNFQMILKHLEKNHPNVVYTLIPHIPNFGRWDDLLVLTGETQKSVFDFIESNLDNPSVSQLLKKWLPRPKQSKLANALRKHLKLSPKAYRKMLVEGSNTVEQKITAKSYSDIDYSKVPSVASSKYRNHFLKNDTERYKGFLSSVKKGESKINASAIFPHDVIRGWRKGTDETMDLQWKALPYNFGNQQGVALISGYSPIILQSILEGDLSAIDPVSIMNKVVMVDRYNWQQ